MQVIDEIGYVRRKIRNTPRPATAYIVAMQVIKSMHRSDGIRSQVQEQVQLQVEDQSLTELSLK